jgi:hypothetical protein
VASAFPARTAPGRRTPKLVQHHGTASEQGDEEGQLERGEECASRIGRDHRLPGRQPGHQRRGQPRVQRAGEGQQANQHDAHASQCTHQPAAQFDQMLDQAAFRIGLRHGADALRPRGRRGVRRRCRCVGVGGRIRRRRRCFGSRGGQSADFVDACTDLRIGPMQSGFGPVQRIAGLLQRA